MKKRNIKHLFIQGAIWSIVHIITLNFRDIYPFNWMLHNKFVYIWIGAFIFTLFDRVFWAYAITIGNIIGLIIGYFIGEHLLSISKAKITPGMDYAQIYHLSHHYHVYIWFTCVVIIFVISILCPIIRNIRGRLNDRMK